MFEPLALSELKYLKVVDLSCNVNLYGLYKWTDILQSFQNTPLRTLIMDRTLSYKLPFTLSADLFTPLKRVKLVQLSLQYNYIAVLEPFLTHLRHLEYMNLDHNYITFLTDKTELTIQGVVSRLKEIHVSHQLVNNYGCRWEHSLFLSAYVSSIGDSTVRHTRRRVTVHLLLESLVINNYPQLGRQSNDNPRVIDITKGYNGYSIISNLSYFDFSSSDIRSLPSVLVGFNNLKEVKLDNNFMESVHPKLFKTLPNLRKLWLSKNRFGLFTGEAKLEEIFSDLNNLNHLDLSDNKLEVLSEGMFKNCSNLETLNIAENAITKIIYNFSNLPNLKILNLSRNQLQGLNETQINELEKIAPENNLTVILDEQETLQCTCDYISFVKWIQDSARKTKIVIDSNITCMTSNGIRKKIFKINIDKLHLECVQNIIITTTLTGTLVITLLCSLIFYYRWNLKYFYYKVKKNHPGVNNNERALIEYDVYISYPEVDLQWANTIRRKLEELNLNVFFPTRDFVPGGNICEETVRGIDKSRKMLLCINENFNNCEYQNFAVQMSCLRGKGFIIPLTKGEIPLNKLSRVVRNLLRDDVYLDWPNEEADEERFWKTLARAIKTRKGVYIEKNGCGVYYSK